MTSKQILAAAAGIVMLSGAHSGWADQVIDDDIIVLGNACIGADCNYNEYFNGDELKVRENNVRINFYDAEAADVFGQSWQLSANDSANGGENRFSILMRSAEKDFHVLSNGTSNPAICDAYAPQSFGAYFTHLLVPAGEPLYQPVPDPDIPTIRAGLQICSSSTTLSDGSAPNPVCFQPVNLSDPATLTDGVIPAGEPIINVTGSANNWTFYYNNCEPVLDYTRLYAADFKTIGEGLTLGVNSESVPGAISVGMADALRQIKNIAESVNDNDAATVAELNSALEQLDAIDEQVSALEVATDRAEALVSIRNFINTGAPTPTLSTYQNGQIDGVTAENLDALNSVVENLLIAPDSRIDGLARAIQGLDLLATEIDLKLCLSDNVQANDDARASIRARNYNRVPAIKLDDNNCYVFRDPFDGISATDLSSDGPFSGVFTVRLNVTPIDSVIPVDNIYGSLYLGDNILTGYDVKLTQRRAPRKTDNADNGQFDFTNVNLESQIKLNIRINSRRLSIAL